jgi:mono/diheme cytochrome c family protein
MNRTSTARMILVFLVALGAAALAADQPWSAPARAAAKKNPVASNATTIEAGRKVFEKECLSCHGPSGKGDGPKAAQLKTQPHDLSAPQIAGQSDGALFWKLNEGRIPMPKFDELLTEEQRWQVIHYVRTFGTAAASTKPPTD